MTILRDQYLKIFGKDEIDRTNRWLGIIETWGELKEEVKIFDYLIKPFDEFRDFNNIETPQRLIVEMNVALTKDDETYNPYQFVNDICSILALATGRLMRPSKHYGIEVDGEIIIENMYSRNYRAHPNITVPIQNNSLQDDLNQLSKSLINIRTEKDIQKHLAIMKALRLYKDSLCLLPVDEDASYVLLVAAGETLGSEFSCINQHLKIYQKVTSYLLLSENMNFTLNSRKN
jgi:hypothetical protein